MLSNICNRLRVVLLLGVAGCAPLTAQQEVDWQHGARRGWVSDIYTADTASSALPKCLTDLPAEQLSAHRFVQVRYRRVRLMRVAVAELPALPDGHPVAIGDRVEVVPRDCGEGQMSRITRMLPEESP